MSRPDNFVFFVLLSMIISAACANFSGAEDPSDSDMPRAKSRQGRQVRKSISFLCALCVPFDMAQDMLCARYSESDRCAKRTLRNLVFSYLCAFASLREIIRFLHLRFLRPLRLIFRFRILFGCGRPAGDERHLSR